MLTAHCKVCPTSKTPKRATPFQARHLIEFGLEVAKKHPNTGVINAMSCKFCIFFGHKEKVGSKRKATSNVKHFLHPFWKECYCSHLLRANPNKWSKYDALPLEEKKCHFVTVLTQSKTTQIFLHNYFSIGGTSSTFKIDLDVVVILIANTLFDGETKDMTIEHFVAPFSPHLTAAEGDSFIHGYFVTIKNLLQFKMSLDMLAL